MRLAGEAGIALRAVVCARFKITRASASLRGAGRYGLWLRLKSAIRRCKLMVRMRGFEDIANETGMAGAWSSIPSQRHHAITQYTARAALCRSGMAVIRKTRSVISTAYGRSPRRAFSRWHSGFWSPCG